MIRRLLLAFLLVLWASAVGFAQQTGFLTVQPGEALSGTFIQERHIKGASAPLRSEGRFLLAPGKGLIWRGEKPFAVVSIITAAGIVQTIDGAETMRMPATRLPFLRQFFDMLSGALAGDLAAMERAFTVTRSMDGERWRLVLKPARRDEPLALQIDSITLSGTRFLGTVEIRKTDGDWEFLTFSDQAVSTGDVSSDDAKLFQMVAP
jgi:hypothetical protein